jgi:hypothetical protein
LALARDDKEVQKKVSMPRFLLEEKEAEEDEEEVEKREHRVGRKLRRKSKNIEDEG